jgi:hypothetical protein
MSKLKDNSQFSEVEHMATDKFNNIYVNDLQLGDTGSGKPSVKKFDTNGNFITKFGSLGKGDGQFTDPEHLAIDSDGNVYVSDGVANTITVFKPVDLLQDLYFTIVNLHIMIITITSV